ncbi:hypothetical protein FQA47_012898 [Oryzias melastigma]|uniref:Uncharacterized protein n=1 Tax=Oryzias melastigma TaxID=30732 RepID=A0A834FF34_ORYME|nr:hypothetical protein FQA47_012898 [Oryzias melastigma]
MAQTSKAASASSYTGPKLLRDAVLQSLAARSRRGDRRSEASSGVQTRSYKVQLLCSETMFARVEQLNSPVWVPKLPLERHPVCPWIQIQ